MFSATVVQSKEAGMVMGKAEAKILFIVCYYVLVGTLVLTLFTYLETISDEQYKAIEQYFICQSTGLEPGKGCGETPQAHLAAFNSLAVVAIILTGLLPTVVLTFTIKCDCKRETN